MYVRRLCSQIAILFWVLLVLFSASIALAAEEGWRIRVNGFWFDPDSTIEMAGPGDGHFRTQVESGAGGAVIGEYRFSPRLGVEIGALGGAESDISVRVGGPNSVFLTDTFSFAALSTGLNFHLTPDSKIDMYVGPLLAYLDYSNVEVGTVALPPRAPFPPFVDPIPVTVVVSIEDEVALGAHLGVDIPVGAKGWLFNADIRYLDATMETDSVVGGRESVAFDPLMVGLGFGYQFGGG